MLDYLRFRKLISSKIIECLFWLFLIPHIVLCGAIASIGGLWIYNGNLWGWLIIAAVIVYLPVGALFIRLWCEVAIVLFKIHDDLHSALMIYRNQIVKSGQ